MDDRIAGAIAGGVVQRLIEKNEPTTLDDREEKKEKDRGHERELGQGLTDRSLSPACPRGCDDASHGNARSVIAKVLERTKVSVLGSPYVTPKTWRLSGVMTWKS